MYVCGGGGGGGGREREREREREPCRNKWQGGPCCVNNTDKTKEVTKAPRERRWVAKCDGADRVEREGDTHQFLSEVTSLQTFKQ